MTADPVAAVGVGHRGRVAVVTGAGSGIGLGVSRRLAAAGARVALVDIDGEAARAAAASLRSQGHSADWFEADVADPDRVRAMCASVVERLGAIHILVNNAGISLRPEGRKADVERLELSQWQRVIAVNLTGAFLCCKYALPAMRRARWGRIVSLSSQGGRGPGIFSSADYSASKAGIGGLTRTLAHEVGPFGITVNAVAPGRVDTSMTALPGEAAANSAYIAQLPVARLATVDEVAAAIAFLTSDEAGYITGATLDINGGGFMT